MFNIELICLFLIEGSESFNLKWWIKTLSYFQKKKLERDVCWDLVLIEAFSVLLTMVRMYHKLESVFHLFNPDLVL